MFRLAALLVWMCACVVYCESITKSYVSKNTKKLQQLISKKKGAKAPFGLSEIFSEHVEDVNKLLTDLKDDNLDSSQNEAKKQEVVNQIAKHMEILQKLLSIINSPSPKEELNRFCSSNNALFHDVICHRPVRKKIRIEKNDLQPAVPTAGKCRRTGHDHCGCEERKY